MFAKAKGKSHASLFVNQHRARLEKDSCGMTSKHMARAVSKLFMQGSTIFCHNHFAFFSWQRFSRNRCHTKCAKKLATFFEFRCLIYSSVIPPVTGAIYKIANSL
jgi:hypothetical protein